ncbi:MAG: HAD family hydrolase [Lachnospira sp.]
MINYNNYKCAIFDLDGTLLHSTGIWKKIDIDFMGKRNIPVTPEFEKEIKLHNFESGAEYVVREYGLNETPKQVMKEWFDMAIDAYANEITIKVNVKEYLHFLKEKGYKLAVATASDEILFKPCLERNGIYDMFDSFTQAKEVERGKNFPDIYYMAAKKTGVKPEECIVFEDVLGAVKAAKTGNFFVVGVADVSSSDDEELIKNHCDIFINDYKELMDKE